MEEQTNYSAPQNSAPEQAPSSNGASTPQQPTGGVGPVMAVVIIVALLILGGLYFWGAQLNERVQSDESALVDGTSNSDIASANDEPDQIEKDLDTFDSAAFESQLDADLKAAESQF